MKWNFLITHISCVCTQKLWMGSIQFWCTSFFWWKSHPNERIRCSLKFENVAQCRPLLDELKILFNKIIGIRYNFQRFISLRIRIRIRIQMWHWASTQHLSWDNGIFSSLIRKTFSIKWIAYMWNYKFHTKCKRFSSHARERKKRAKHENKEKWWLK